MIKSLLLSIVMSATVPTPVPENPRIDVWLTVNGAQQICKLVFFNYLPSDKRMHIAMDCPIVIFTDSFED